MSMVHTAPSYGPRGAGRSPSPSFRWAFLPVLIGALLILAGPGLAQNREADQERQDANRDRCRNGVMLGGAAGAAITRGNVLNRLGGAALGGAAGCVINRGWNEGK